MENDKIQLFEDRKIRTAWDEEQEEWYFSVVDVVAVLTDSVDPTAYWRKLKQRLKNEGNETVTNCHGLKMTATDGKKRMTDVATMEQLLRIIQSIPSPKAEPFKAWFRRYLYAIYVQFPSGRLGIANYCRNHTQGGYPNQYIHYHYSYLIESEGIKQYVIDHCGLCVHMCQYDFHSSASDDIQNGFVTPFDVKWEYLINWDHNLPCIHRL